MKIIMKNAEYFPMGLITDLQNQISTQFHEAYHCLLCLSTEVSSLRSDTISFIKTVFKWEENTAYCFCKTSALQGCFNSSWKVNLLPKNIKSDKISL